MSRFVGSFMDDNELDRPDLNKCPDCECFFPQDNCPICGKECPEEMRAGNRKKQKKKVQRNGRSKAVQYIDWYHRWWFIILMLFIFPIVGIILLASSPHKKGVKIAIIAVAVIYTIVSYFGFGNLYGQIKSIFEKPVDTSLSQKEYIDKCVLLPGDEYYRRANDYKGDYVKIQLTVVEVLDTDKDAYYRCSYFDGRKTYELFIRDCVIEDPQKFVQGDVIVVYGECAGNVSIYYGYDFIIDNGPCINAAYIRLFDGSN